MTASDDPGPAWARSVESVTLDVACDGTRHTVRWQAGEVVLDDHEDIDAERALVAFGGDELPCLSSLDLWNEAVLDGGFLGEWVDGELDPPRLWWLGMALERMRNEGFHEFLRDLPVGRANRMGRFLTQFPEPWLDRAAAQVAEHMIDGDGVVCLKAPVLIPQAVARRVRRAFVLSVGGRQIAFGAAALVPFRPTVGDRIAPAVAGEIKGRSSWATLSVDQRWLFEVWGAGASVVDGRLVLAMSDGEASVVDWQEVDGRWTPRLLDVSITHDGDRWALEL